MIELLHTALPGVFVVVPRVLRDRRGFFLETYVRPRFQEAGIACDFVQDNLSYSTAGVLRGIHFQLGWQGQPGQAKLVRAITGRIVDVAVDLRRGSPTFGQWVQTELSADNQRALFIPAGFGHAFYALEPSHVFYKCSDVYRPEQERGVVWNDPSLSIAWPGQSPQVSARDAALPRLAELSEADLPPSREHGESRHKEEVGP
jgi:dTDP-4-dehydrorhamnose 3,5-epimerase